MKKLITLLILATAWSAHAQNTAAWTYGATNSSAPITINPDYAHQAVAVHGGTALWGTILNNQFVVGSQMGDYKFSELDTNGNVVNSTVVTGALTVFSAHADNAGNWYVLGIIEDSLAFANSTTYFKTFSGPNTCMFRLDAGTLNCSWVKPMGDNFMTSVSCFTIQNNQIYFPVDSIDQTSICRMDPATGNSTALWKQTRQSYITSIQADSRGNVYLVGTCAFNGIDFNGHLVTLPTGFQYPQYIVRYKADGTYDWSYFMQDGTCINRQLTLADDNTLYYTGPLNDSLTLNNIHLHAPSQLFLGGGFLAAKMDSTGAFSWAKQMSDTATGEAFLTRDIHAVLGPNKSLVLLANTERFNDWGNGVTTYATPGDNTSTVVSYDMNGNAMWAKQITGSYVAGQQIAGDGNNIWITGNAYDTAGIRMDNITVTMPGGTFAYYPFVARLGVGSSPNNINDLERSQFRIVPNPAQNYFTISFDLRSGKQLSMRIMDNLGRVVTARSVASGDSIPVSDLPKGLYFVELIDQQTKMVEKLIVQ